MRNRDRSPGRNSRKDYEAPRGQDRRGGYARRGRDRGDRGDRGERAFKNRSARRGGERSSNDRRDRGDRPPRRGQLSAEEALTASGDLKSERNYDNSIFVGNIPFEVTAKEIEEVFSKDFSVVRADIVIRRGVSRGMATVEFSSTEDVEKAIAKFDRTEYQGREIFVRQDYPPPADKKSEEAKEPREPKRLSADEEPREPKTEIFVGNLAYSTSWQTLKDKFRDVGDIVRADVLKDRFGKPRGYGTVVFKTIEDAQKAIDTLNGEVLEGRPMDVRFARDPKAAPGGKTNTPFAAGVKSDGPASKVIYVGNLPYITTEGDLFDLFETVGRVTRAEIQLEARGRPSGNAVVEFEMEELADLAIKNLSGYNYGGRRLLITYAQYPEQGQSEEADSDAQMVEN